MNVSVANAAKGDVDLHIVCARCTTRDGHGLKGLVARVGAVGLDGHGEIA